MWEDVHNRSGGRWIVPLTRQQRITCVDNFWLETMLCLIGESFGADSIVNGAVVSVRGKGDKIGVWVKDASSEDAVLGVGMIIKERLGLLSGSEKPETAGRAASTAMMFDLHEETINKAGSMTKHRFCI